MTKIAMVSVNGIVQSPSDYSIINNYVHLHNPIGPLDHLTVHYVEDFKYEVLASADVDNEPWVTVRANKEISAWLRPLKNESVYELKPGEGLFDMPERIFLLLKLKW